VGTSLDNQMIIAVFVLYMGVLFVLGFIASRSTKTEEDFFIGGRKIGTWVTAISSTASSESGWVLLGTVGLVYKEGLAAVWFMPGCLLGYWFNWRFIAPRLRSCSIRDEAITIPDFLESEVGRGGGAVRIVAVIIIFFSMMAYVAAQLTAAGKAFTATFSIDYATSIMIGSLIIIFYTLLGGFRAVSWTDLIQGLLMVFSLIVLPLIAFCAAGGMQAVLDDLSRNNLLSLLKTNGIYASIGSLLGLLGIGLGYPGQPHVLIRFMAASDDSVILRGKIIALMWGFFVYSGSIMLGLAGRVLLPAVADQEHVFPMIASLLLHPVLAGVMLAAVMSAIMSTADSQLLVASSSMVRDIYEKVLNRSVEQKKLLLLSRISVLVLGLISIAVAISDTRIVFWFVLFAWSGLGASFGPLITLLLFGYRFRPLQAVIGMLLGFFITILWKSGFFDAVFGVSLSQNLYELIPAFTLSFLYLRIVGTKIR